jgi:plasmid segregation protein ParM
MIVGLDVGYGYTKALSGTAEVMFPSIVGPAIDIKYQNELASADRGLEVDIAGRRQFVGELARLQSSLPVSPLARERDLDIVRTLALTAIQQIGADGGEVTLITGLPVSWYQDAEDLKSVLQGRHVYWVNGERAWVEVTEVRVIPQPFGTLFRTLLNRRGILTDPKRLTDRRVAIIDVGTYTTDYALSDALRYVEPRSGSTQSAMAEVYKLLQRTIGEQYDLELDLRDVESALRAGAVTLYGDQVSIEPFIKSAVDEVAGAIIAQAESLWPNRARTFAAVLLTGGGASFVHDRVSDVFPHAQLVDNAQLANAEGFWRYGTFKARQTRVDQRTSRTASGTLQSGQIAGQRTGR